MTDLSPQKSNNWGEEYWTDGHIEVNVPHRSIQSMDIGNISQSSTAINDEHLQHNVTQVCSDPQLTTATILTAIDISGLSNLNKTDWKTAKGSSQLTREEKNDHDNYNQQKRKTVTKSSNNCQSTKTDTNNKLEAILPTSFDKNSKLHLLETALPRDMCKRITC